MTQKKLLSIILVCAIFYFFYQTTSSVLISSFIQSPSKVGALFPSTSYVSNELMRNMKKHTQAIRVLEIGCGSGAVTSAILDNLKPEDSFDALETDHNFFDALQTKFENNDRIHLHNISFEDWQPEYKYDVIISTLPLGNFPPKLVNSFMSSVKRLAAVNGTVSYIEYMGTYFLKSLVLDTAEKNALLAKRESLAQFNKENNGYTNNVWLSLPPLYVHHVQL